jgi:MFS family permease
MAMLSNLVPHATDQGIPAPRAAFLVSLLAMLAIVGKLGFGFLSERLDLRVGLWIAMGLMAIGFLGLLSARSYPGIALSCLPLGLAAGGLLPIWGAMIAQGFGAADYGRALGLMNPVMMPFTFAAPPATGWVFDTMGNYDWAFRSFLVALLVAALLLATVRLPAREPAPA